MIQGIIGNGIEFRNSDGDLKTGIVLDKVKVLPVGASANYDNYLVVEITSQKTEVINPLNIIKIIPKRL